MGSRRRGRGRLFHVDGPKTTTTTTTKEEKGGKKKKKKREPTVVRGIWRLRVSEAECKVEDSHRDKSRED